MLIVRPPILLLLGWVLGPAAIAAGTPSVDSAALTGKVMVGYQGWFNAEGDGAGRGYNHWSRGGAKPAPDNVRVDLWPDLSEFPADERFPTDLRHADGPNMKPAAPLDAIPRLRGRFLWSQVTAAKRAGADMLYVAMFDEVDEGTAIFKVTNSPPVGLDENVQFLGYEGLPSDHYLRLTGVAGKLFRGEPSVDDEIFRLLPPSAP
jgi:hypothetical protein